MPSARFETMQPRGRAYRTYVCPHDGGEVTGTSDERIRHRHHARARALPANRTPHRTDISGEAPAECTCGCRVAISWGVVRNGNAQLDRAWLVAKVSAATVDRPAFLLVSQHPVKYETVARSDNRDAPGTARRCVRGHAWPTLTPVGRISRGMRKFREQHTTDYIGLQELRSRPTCGEKGARA